MRAVFRQVEQWQPRVHGQPVPYGTCRVAAEVVHDQDDRAARIARQQVLQEGDEVSLEHPLNIRSRTR